MQIVSILEKGCSSRVTFSQKIGKKILQLFHDFGCRQIIKSILMVEFGVLFNPCLPRPIFWG